MRSTASSEAVTVQAERFGVLRLCRRTASSRFGRALSRVTSACRGAHRQTPRCVQSILPNARRAAARVAPPPGSRRRREGRERTPIGMSGIASRNVLFDRCTCTCRCDIAPLARQAIVPAASFLFFTALTYALNNSLHSPCSTNAGAAARAFHVAEGTPDSRSANRMHRILPRRAGTLTTTLSQHHTSRT